MHVFGYQIISSWTSVSGIRKGKPGQRCSQTIPTRSWRDAGTLKMSAGRISLKLNGGFFNIFSQDRTEIRNSPANYYRRRVRSPVRTDYAAGCQPGGFFYASSRDFAGRFKNRCSIATLKVFVEGANRRSVKRRTWRLSEAYPPPILRSPEIAAKQRGDRHSSIHRHRLCF